LNLQTCGRRQKLSLLDFKHELETAGRAGFDLSGRSVGLAATSHPVGIESVAAALWATEFPVLEHRQR
jgi:hypothetical protein